MTWWQTAGHEGYGGRMKGAVDEGEDEYKREKVKDIVDWVNGWEVSVST